ncbi:MAG: HAMP domain-containing sensor histidine kinase [Caldilineaceae bacterium]
MLRRVTPGDAWPWQRSFQARIVLAYAAMFFVVLFALTAAVGRIFYRVQLAQAEHELEVKAFLLANTLEDPLSGFADEFDAFAHYWQKHGRTSPNQNTETLATTSPEDFVKERPEAPRLLWFVNHYSDEKNARVTVLDEWGNLLVDNQVDAAIEPNQFGQVEIQAALQNREQHNVRIDPMTGIRTLYVAAPIQQGAHTLGVVQLSLPMSAVTATARWWLFMLITASLASLTVTVAVGIWISYKLAAPMRQLEQAALAIAQGDMTRRAPVERADELGSLANAFNYMLDQLSRVFSQQRDFVTNASHELRTPLANIMLRVDALMRNTEFADVLNGDAVYLKEIGSETDRLNRLANEMLELARLENQLETQPLGDAALHDDPNCTLAGLEIAQIITSVAQSTAQRAAAKQLTFTSPSAHFLEALAELAIFVRRTHFESVLYNLLDNAIKYTPAGGDVNLQIAIAPPNPMVGSGRELQITVQDTGQGIPKEDLPYIFERFYRVDKARSRTRDADNFGNSGAGLGLAIVRSIVDAYEGKIWVESTVGKGTQVTVKFHVKA